MRYGRIEIDGIARIEFVRNASDYKLQLPSQRMQKFDAGMLMQAKTFRGYVLEICKKCVELRFGSREIEALKEVSDVFSIRTLRETEAVVFRTTEMMWRLLSSEKK